MKRRTILRSLILAPLAAVFGWVKPGPRTWIVKNGETLDLNKTGPNDKIILENGTAEWTNSDAT